jgi:hypothetical protein
VQAIRREEDHVGLDDEPPIAVEHDVDGRGAHGTEGMVVDVFVEQHRGAGDHVLMGPERRRRLPDHAPHEFPLP